VPIQFDIKKKHKTFIAYEKNDFLLGNLFFKSFLWKTTLYISTSSASHLG